MVAGRLAQTFDEDMKKGQNIFDDEEILVIVEEALENAHINT